MPSPWWSNAWNTDHHAIVKIVTNCHVILFPTGGRLPGDWGDSQKDGVSLPLVLRKKMWWGTTGCKTPVFSYWGLWGGLRTRHSGFLPTRYDPQRSSDEKWGEEGREHKRITNRAS
jgi:hypothetical protein